MKARLGGPLVAALLVLASGATAQDRRDLRITDAVVREVTTYTQFTIFDDVNARIENGVVTLTGKVTMPYKKTDIERRVAKIEGGGTTLYHYDQAGAGPGGVVVRRRDARVRVHGVIPQS